MPELSIDDALRLALQHHQSGRLAEASSIYTQILRVQPGHAEALHLLGVIAHQNGRHQEAKGLILQSLALQPRSAGALSNLGLVLLALGELQPAESSIRTAMQIDPNLIEASCALGTLLVQSRRFAEAEQCYREAMIHHPKNPGVRIKLARLLLDLGRNNEAVSLLHETRKLHPAYGEAALVLGNALRAAGDLPAAIDSYRAALLLEPDNGPALNNLGFVLYELGQFDEAERNLRRAIALSPQFPDPHANLSLILLLQGKFQEGWREYRWRPAQNSSGTAVHFPQPLWDGSNFAGRTLLLRCDQGAGDTIQSVRFVPQVLARGGEVLIECERSLLRLLEAMRLLKNVKLVPTIKPPTGQVERFDVQFPQMSLMQVMGIAGPADIPSPPAYAVVRPEWREKWRDVPESGTRGLKVGLAWAGSPLHLRDRSRSIALAEFAPLGHIGATFYSLQMGAAAAQLRSPPPSLSLIDLTNRIEDFADTAALIERLDLVICVDTAVAHLAGALGKPVWVLLPAVPDFRWLLDREDTPWYPTMRLFRQRNPGDWAEVIGRVADELSRRGGHR